MNTKTSPLRRALKAAKEAMGPQRYGPDGRPIVCHCCGHDRFTIAPSIVTWYTLACAECGHLEFFLKKPEWIRP
jgi:hypothetical protein